MEDEELNLLLKYPLISKNLEGSLAVFKGSIHVNDEDYKIHITKTNDDDYDLTLPEKLKHFQEEFEILMKKTRPKNIVIILDSLSSFIGAKIPTTKPVDHCDGYRHVLYEYSDFTNFYLNLKTCRLAHDLSKISISTYDQGGREHFVEVGVNFEGKDSFGVTSCDLPEDKERFKKSGSLKDVYEQILGAIDAFQPFLDVVDAFDVNCWVLDPAEPQRACAYRRIWLAENFSVIITLDPSDVFKLPEIKFLGPERLVEEYRRTLNTNIEMWEPRNGVFSEISKLLGLESFPPRPAADERGPELLVRSGDCSICFSDRLNDKLPEVVCKNKYCENCYHAKCLYEWLMSVNARKFFSEVVGLCPNCEKNISCPIPN